MGTWYDGRVNEDFIVRALNEKDVERVMALMKPFIQKGTLLPRAPEEVTQSIGDYMGAFVGEELLGSMALHVYNELEAELAAVAISPQYSDFGVGRALIESLLKKAKDLHLKSVFLLTTGDGAWFSQFGFTPDSVESLPPARKAKYDKKRASKVFRLKL